MRAVWTGALAFTLISLAAETCQAWNDAGHMLVALMAHRQLSDAERDRIDAVLRSHPHYSRYLVRGRPDGAPLETWVFLRAATWPDEVRGERYRADYHRAKWHYINVPFVPAAERPHVSTEPFDEPKPNIVFSIAECDDILSDRNASRRRQALHLAWLIHLVGDVHQPLHCTALVTREFRAGDQGGNKLAVRVGSSVLRLHSYWDGLLGRDDRWETLEAAAEDLSDMRYAPTSDEAGERRVTGWVEEGRQAAIEFAYLDGELPLADYDRFDDGQLEIDEIPRLGQDYSEPARELARKKAVLAAHRLATMLRRRF